MLKCHLDDRTGTCSIAVQGNLTTVLTDVTYLISDIYRSVLVNNPLLADAFRHMLRETINEDSSPVWEKQKAHESGEDGVKGVSIQIPRDILDGFRGGIDYGE